MEAITEHQRLLLHPYLPRTDQERIVRKEVSPQSDNALISGPATSVDGRDTSNVQHALGSERKHRAKRPFVTLTYATSLDSMIAIAPGARTTLSGSESKSMTHYLRKHHDAVLVGVNTAVADDPGLNCRYPGCTIDEQPYPVVLDPNGRWDPHTSKALKLHARGEGKQLLVLGRSQNDHSDGLWNQVTIQNDPASAIGVSHTKIPHIEWSTILETLYERDVKSVMIEGGASIINELLSQPGLVDSVIITVAPTFLGKGGVVVSPSPKLDENGKRVNAVFFNDIQWIPFGHDMVLCAHL